MNKYKAISLFLFLVFISFCFYLRSEPVSEPIVGAIVSSGVYPDVKGAINPAITQATIGKTICNKNWSTKSIRPSVSVTNKIKISKLPSGHQMSEYELDHLISLELGGAPADPNNLWDEPWNIVVSGEDLGAHTKDKVENRLHKEVCAGTLTLAQAQHIVVTDWVKYYHSMQ